MPDTRRVHYTTQPSLLNQPNPQFHSAARSLYGDRGPVQAAHTGRQEPQSLADHVDLALDRVKGLGRQQKMAVHNEICRMLRDIDVIRLIMHSARGPYSEQAVTHDSQGNTYTA
jgi:hypothetical protein